MKYTTKTSEIKQNRQTAQFKISGMSCQGCATRLENTLKTKESIDSASVNFAGETLNITFDNSRVDQNQIFNWVDESGFSAEKFELTHLNSSNESEKDWRLILVWLCLLPFLPGMIGMLLGQGMIWMPPIWLQFSLATLVQFGLATPFYKSAWASIKGRLANMDVLVVIGTVTIWAYSTYVWLDSLGVSLFNFQPRSFALTDSLNHQHTALPVYFEAGVMIIAFIKLGKYLEKRTKRHSLNSINMLLELTPKLVERLTIPHESDDQQVETISLDKVNKGDVLRAKQGSRIATDGVVESGLAWCDESHLTGESLPISKEKGDMVLAGALVDNGSLTYRVTATGKDTQLSDMVNALSEAQGSKASLARIADKVAGVFVPVVVLIALATFGLTWWLTGAIDKAVLHSVSVLVIACPCALGLATPAAIMAGMGVAARHGIWFKDAQSLEVAGNIDTVVFDKTGTLTKGKPTIIDVYTIDERMNEDKMLQLAASVEAHVSHPLATSIVNAAKSRRIELLAATDVNSVTGKGVEAFISSHGNIKIGTLDFIGSKLPQDKSGAWDIASTVAVSLNDKPLGVFALADEIKSESIDAIQVLKNDELDIVLLSGDKQSVVDHVASELNIDTAVGELSPRDKSSWIKTHEANNHKVAMVGDGVNDAPAMATASASFAMLEGTEVAKHSASARLMGESLMQVHAGIDIAKATLRNIKQNLFFAFIYNCLGIPLAAFGLLNPIIAAAAMALSSISVLMNALRLNRHEVANRD